MLLCITMLEEQGYLQLLCDILIWLWLLKSPVFVAPFSNAFWHENEACVSLVLHSCHSSRTCVALVLLVSGTRIVRKTSSRKTLPLNVYSLRHCGIIDVAVFLLCEKLMISVTKSQYQYGDWTFHFGKKKQLCMLFIFLSFFFLYIYLQSKIFCLTYNIYNANLHRLKFS